MFDLQGRPGLLAAESLAAHTPNPLGAWHSLRAHLEQTAAYARQFAGPMGAEAEELAYLAPSESQLSVRRAC